MKRILIENISEKMALAKEVTGTSGNVLLAKGIILTPSMAHRLKNWGVSFVYVEGENDLQETSNDTSVSPAEIREHLESKFSNVIGSEIMKKIFAAVYSFKLQQPK